MTVPMMKNYINGEWVESSTDAIGYVRNPALTIADAETESSDAPACHSSEF